MGRAAAKLGAAGLIVAMIFCAMMLWLGIPLAWLYIGSQVVDSSQPSMGPYMLVAVGILGSVIVDALILNRLNHAYQRVTGTDARVRIQLPWMRSMRGERESGRPTGVLDIIMVATVAVAATASGIWFFFFAGSSLPGGAP